MKRTMKIVVELNADYESVREWNRAMIDLTAKKAIVNPTTGNWLTLGLDLIKQRLFKKRYKELVFKDRKYVSLDEAIQQTNS